jgi:Arc/MetJ family transcription regulator
MLPVRARPAPEWTANDVLIGGGMPCELGLFGRSPVASDHLASRQAGTGGCGRPASRDSPRRSLRSSSRLRCVIFKQVGEGRPYPDHARSSREWAEIPPRPVRLDQLITTKNVLDLQQVLAQDSTFYGDLFPHVIRWRGELYLEDGLHRALRAALHQRLVLHARVLELD